MKISRYVMISLSALYFAGNQSAVAVDEQRLDTVQNNLEEIQTSVERLPPPLEEAVSGSGQNLGFLGSRFRALRAGLGAATPLPVPPAAFAPGQASRPEDDRRFSQFAGFTQSSTSTAWCGANAVVAYTDSGSFLETTILTTGGFSLVGYARSTTATATTPTFIDKGFLNPGPTATDTLGGDPVAICTNASTFYIASLFFRDGTSEISVSKSTDGGNNFGLPISAVSKDASTHFLDKPWMAGKGSTIYVTYTDFDSAASCTSGFRTAIELVRSSDGGATWSVPTVVAEVCDFEVVQGSQVAVGPDGKVYVAWEFIGQDSVNDRAQFVTSSIDGGVSFLPPVQVAQVACVGSCGGVVPTPSGLDPQLLRGLFRSGLEFPSLAVNPNNSNTVYLTWHDARVYKDDSFSQNGYGFADVVFSKSTTGGTVGSWSAPVRVNNNTNETPGKESDQYQPAIAVSKANKLAICFYDRRASGVLNGINSAFDRWCATSTTGIAGSWANTKRNSGGPFAPTPGQDLVVNPFYFGDYDTLTTDGTGVNTALFLGAWSQTFHGNPDVQALKF